MHAGPYGTCAAARRGLMMHTGPYGTCAALYTRVTFASCKNQTTLTSPAPCSKTHMHARTSVCLKPHKNMLNQLCALARDRAERARVTPRYPLYFQSGETGPHGTCVTNTWQCCCSPCYASVCLSVYSSVCLCICLSLCPSVCLSVCLSVSVSLSQGLTAPVQQLGEP